jgi:WD40 repeat protein
VGASSNIYTAAKFSPDGKTIAVGGEKIFFLSVPGQKSPLEGQVIEGYSGVSQIAWSPDGQALAIRGVGSTSNNNTPLQIIDLVGGRVTGKITTVVDNVWMFDWTRQ